MKKFLILLITTLVFSSIIFAEEIKKPISEVIVKSFIDEGLTIEEYIIYNEETDPNNQLGRPKKYVEKINFSDKTIKQKEEELTGGTIEVFLNEKDMELRKNYIEKLMESYAFISYYIYSKGNVLLRLEGELLPSKAKEYEKVFIETVENYK